MVSQARSFLSSEWALFGALPKNAKILLRTSVLFTFAMPVISVFVSAFILRNSMDINHVMAFQFAVYVGIPIAFYFNRYLLSFFRHASLYAFGIVSCGAMLIVMTCLNSLTMTRILESGVCMGLGMGFLWANRNFLVLVCTHDRDRNYYFGVESFSSCLSGVLVPIGVGAFIVWWGGQGAVLANVKPAYQWVACGVFALTVCAAWFLRKIEFPATRPSFAIRARFTPAWKGLLLVAVLRGTVQVFLTTAPAILIMRVLGGQESALGVFQSVGAVFAAMMMYLIGRNTLPKHRIRVFALSLLLYALGAVLNAARFDYVSVLFFMACQILAQPMLEMSYGLILLRVLDVVSAKEKESEYAYIFSHEMAVFAGRMLGAAAFMLVSYSFSGDMAFRYVIALMALLHLLSWPVAVSISKRLACEEA